MANTQNLDLVKPLGTDHALVSVLNSNSDKIDAYAGAVNAGLDGLRDGLGILADGNTHAAVTSGQFVYVKNHQTLPEGLYQASTNIAANGTLSTSNLTADPKGGLNTLSEHIATQTGSLTAGENITLYNTNLSKSGNVVSLVAEVVVGSGGISANGTVVFTIPSAFRPSAYRLTVTKALYGGIETNCSFRINPNGNITTNVGNNTITGSFIINTTYMI